MKADCFFLIFNSPHIVDKIRSHFPKYIKHTETILSNCHIPSGSLNYLSYDEFLIYCAFYFNYQDIIVNNPNKLGIKVSPKLVDVIAEENKFDILQKIYIYYILPLENNIYTNKQLYGTYRSLISAVKHNNLKLLQMLHQQLNITFSSSDTSNCNFYNNIHTQDVIINILNIAIRVGNVKIIEYICDMIDIYNNRIQMLNEEKNKFINNTQNEIFVFGNTIFNKLLSISIVCYHLDCSFYIIKRYSNLLIELPNNNINNLKENIIRSSSYLLNQYLQKSYFNNINHINELNHFKTIVNESHKPEINYIIEDIKHVLQDTVLEDKLKLKYIISQIYKISNYIELDKTTYNYRYTYIYKNTTYNDILVELCKNISYKFNEKYDTPNIMTLIPKYRKLFQIIKNRNIPIEDIDCKEEEKEEKEEDIFGISEIEEVLTQLHNVIC